MDTIEDWRVVTVFTPRGFALVAVLDDGVQVLAVIDLEAVTPAS